MQVTASKDESLRSSSSPILTKVSGVRECQRCSFGLCGCEGGPGESRGDCREPGHRCEEGDVAWVPVAPAGTALSPASVAKRRRLMPTAGFWNADSSSVDAWEEVRLASWQDGGGVDRITFILRLRSGAPRLPNRAGN